MMCALATVVSGCSLFHKAADKILPPVKTVHFADDITPEKLQEKQFESGLALMRQGNYREAVAAFAQLNRDYPASKFSPEAEYQSARCQEHLHDFPLAITGYRAVVTHSTASEKLKAMALYRLSFCYEALGDEVRVLAALEDAIKRKDLLAGEVATAEVPARLAAVYARLGNRESALTYFALAEKGLEQIRRKARAEGSSPEWLAKTLFYMGQMTVSALSTVSFTNQIQSLSQAQLYLLQSAEANHPVWSERAADQLIQIYSELWQRVSQRSTNADEGGEDRESDGRNAVLEARDISGQILAALDELKLAKLPGDEAVPAVNKITQFTEELRGKIGLFLSQTATSSLLTPEAEALRQEKREGKVKDTESILEKRAKEKKTKGKGRNT
mgnify:CR=1 FL=1